MFGAEPGARFAYARRAEKPERPPEQGEGRLHIMHIQGRSARQRANINMQLYYVYT